MSMATSGLLQKLVGGIVMMLALLGSRRVFVGSEGCTEMLLTAQVNSYLLQCTECCRLSLAVLSKTSTRKELLTLYGDAD